MQAIILAAGMGKRLGCLTKENTKCMVKVCGTTLIERLLNQIVQHEFNQIVIVVGHFGDKLKNLVGDNYKGIPVKYVENPIYQTTNNIYSLYLAKNYLVNDDTVLFESDLIFDDTILTALLDNPYPNLSIVAKFENWMDGTVVTLDDENNILSFIPKKNFDYMQSDQYFKTVNIYKFSQKFSQTRYVPFLEAYSKSIGNNEYYEDVLRVIALLETSSLKAMKINTGEKWYEIDDVQDIDIAETLFSNDQNMLHHYQKRYGGYWRFPDLLDFCYLVNPFFPNKRMKEEMKMSFDTLLCEYPSGMMVNSMLAGKYFNINADFIVAGNGAAELIKSLTTLLHGKMGMIFPTFEEYPNRMKKEDIIPYIPNNLDFSYTVDDLMLFYNDKSINSILIINPDNPSGNFILRSDLFRLIEWAKQKKIDLIVDESFVDFSDESSTNSLLDSYLLEDCPNLIVVRSISKSYGVPGLRLGIVASGNIELIYQIKQDVAIWNINSFAEFYMQIFGKYSNDYQKACDEFIKERHIFFEALKTIPFLRVIPSQANYFLCEVKQPYTARTITTTLLTQHNILIKDCSTKDGFDGRQFIRISVRSREDNQRLTEALHSI